MDVNRVPKVSIIVPVYKTEQFLPKCIESILVQTFTDFELLLIDDGSPDRSGEICDEYVAKDCRIRVFHKKNGGVSSARNVGLDNARGEWIVFVDSDDWVDEKYLHSVEAALCNSVDVINIGFIILDENCEVKNVISYQEKKYSIEDFFKRDVFYGGICSYIIRSDMLKCYTIRFSENISIGEDREFMTKCILKSRLIQSVSGAHYFYRFHTFSSINTRLNYEKILDNLIVVNNIYNYVRIETSFCPYNMFLMRWYRLGIDSYLNLLIRDMPKDICLYRIKKDFHTTMSVLNFVEFDFFHTFVFRFFGFFTGFCLFLFKIRYFLK